jgi:hypothetical protein
MSMPQRILTGKVFANMTTPTVVRNQTGALDLLVIGDGER